MDSFLQILHRSAHAAYRRDSSPEPSTGHAFPSHSAICNRGPLSRHIRLCGCRRYSVFTTKHAAGRDACERAKALEYPRVTRVFMRRNLVDSEHAWYSCFVLRCVPGLLASDCLWSSSRGVGCGAIPGRCFCTCQTVFVSMNGSFRKHF